MNDWKEGAPNRPIDMCTNCAHAIVIVNIAEEKIEEKQNNLKANTGKFKAGDRVKVVRKCESMEGDWDAHWNTNMDGEVGKMGEIHQSKNNKGYSVLPSGWNFPEFVLEKVEPIFYTEDFEDGSFPRRSCENCTNPICTLTGQLLRSCCEWEGKLKGEPIYRGENCWMVNGGNYYVSLYTWTGNSTYEDTKYFSNEKNAREYCKSISPKYVLTTVDGVKLRKGDKAFIWAYAFDYPKAIIVEEIPLKNNYFSTEEAAYKYVFDAAVEALKERYKQTEPKQSA